MQSHQPPDREPDPAHGSELPPASWSESASASSPGAAEQLYLAFAEAAESRTPSEYQLAFDALCAEHPEHAAELRRLRQLEGAVEELLQNGSSFFRPGSAPLVDAGRGADGLARSFQPGETIGDFTLVRFIGHGGMGQVWEARQNSMRRPVALKFLLPGRADERMIALFEREARAGGRANHPNLVRTLARGETDGIEWIAQELVEGSFSLRDAIERFRREPALPKDYYRRCASLVQAIAQGLQAAHDAGVIHRDLKPQNILIDSRDTPRVADFGLARIEGDTVLSKSGDVAGTYQYMSPEQVSGARSEIDHRTDVFSLGVVLYELLTLQRPFNGDTTHQVAEQIAAFDPPEPSKLRAQCPRDLSLIALKALEKRPAARYASMRAFAEDIGRFLRHEPILAQPATRLESVRKWVMRNPAPSMGMAVGAVALVVISGVAVYARLQATEAAKQAKRADERAMAAETSENVARERAEQLKQVSEFQNSILGQIDATSAGIEWIKDLQHRYAQALRKAGMSEDEQSERMASLGAELARVNATDAAAALMDRMLLKPAVQALDSRFRDDPATESQLRIALADIYEGIGLHEQSHDLRAAALETRRRTFGQDHLETAAAVHGLGSLLLAMGRLQEAEPYSREALRVRRRLLGEDHSETLNSLNTLGALMEAHGRMDEAEECFSSALRGWRRATGNESGETLLALHNLAYLSMRRSRLPEAENRFLEVLEISRRVKGSDDPFTLGVIGNLGVLYSMQAMHDQARPYCEEAFQRLQRVRGEAHPETILASINLGGNLLNRGRVSEAEACLREADRMACRVLGADHPQRIAAIALLAGVSKRQHRWAEAELLHEEVLDRRRRVLGVDHADTLGSALQLASIWMEQRRPSQAEDLLQESVERATTALEAGHPVALRLKSLLRASLSEQGKYVDAEARARLNVESNRRLLGAEHPSSIGARLDWGITLEALGRLTEAEQVYLDGLQCARRVLGSEHPETRRGLNCLGVLLFGQGKADAAEPYYREALERARGNRGETNAEALIAMCNLANLLVFQSKHQEAIELLEPNLSIARSTLMEADPLRMAHFLDTLGSARMGLGHDEQRFRCAERELIEAHGIFRKVLGQDNPRTVSQVRSLVDLYTAWDQAVPDQGYVTRAAEWKAEWDASRSKK